MDTSCQMAASLEDLVLRLEASRRSLEQGAAEQRVYRLYRELLSAGAKQEAAQQRLRQRLAGLQERQWLREEGAGAREGAAATRTSMVAEASAFSHASPRPGRPAPASAGSSREATSLCSSSTATHTLSSGPRSRPTTATTATTPASSGKASSGQARSRWGGSPTTPGRTAGSGGGKPGHGGRWLLPPQSPPQQSFFASGAGSVCVGPSPVAR